MEALCALLVEVGLLLSWGAVVVLEGEARGAGSGDAVAAAAVVAVVAEPALVAVLALFADVALPCSAPINVVAVTALVDGLKRKLLSVSRPIDDWLPVDASAANTIGLSSLVLLLPTVTTLVAVVAVVDVDELVALVAVVALPCNAPVKVVVVRT